MTGSAFFNNTKQCKTTQCTHYKGMVKKSKGGGVIVLTYAQNVEIDALYNYLDFLQCQPFMKFPAPGLCCIVQFLLKPLILHLLIVAIAS